MSTRLGSMSLFWLALAGYGTPNTLSAQEYFEYAVKIICGSPPPERAAVAPGTYFTAINIHNPNPNPIDTVFFRKKFALTAARGRDRVQCHHFRLMSWCRTGPSRSIVPTSSCERESKGLQRGLRSFSLRRSWMWSPSTPRRALPVK